MGKQVKVVGYNAKKEAVLEELVDVAEGEEQSSLWSDPRKVIELGMSFLKGQLFDDDGEVYEEFERTFDPQSGEELGSKTYSNDSGVDTKGIYD